MTAVRFAPRLAIALDLDGAREALFNWLFARQGERRFLLCHHDIGGADAPAPQRRDVEVDLAWLGLGWDVFARQSERLALYAGAIERLRAAGRLYREPGDASQWRFALRRAAIGWEDLIRGPVEVVGGALADPAVLDADGMPVDVFTAVVDDIAFEISHVIRSEDRIATTPAQIELFAALGRAPPRFAHFPRLPEGEPSIAALREGGWEPMAINSLLATLGTAEPASPRLRLEELVATFDFDRFDRAPPPFDLAALAALNAALLHLMPFNAAAHRLPAGAGTAFWEAVRPWLARFADVETWWRVCQGPVTPARAAADEAFLARAAELLPAEPLDPASWDKWLDRLNALSGRKGEAMLAPLRLALTGRADGPSLAPLLPLIGRARAHARLTGTTA